MRSLAMLAPGQPGLSKEEALHAVHEVRRLLARERQLVTVLGQVRSLLADFDTPGRVV